MRLRTWLEPQQGATYDDVLAAALATEEAGLDALFRSDHYLRIGAGEHGPGSTDAWITLAGLARETSRIRLGTLVTPVTFRLPGPLAVAVAQVDAMSGGRVELGLGAGWFEAEHEAYGIPFHTRRERFDLFEEQLQIVRGLWGTPPGETFSFAGEHYRLVDSPALPKPVQSPGPPIVVGGGGTLRTPGLAARYADEYNAIYVDPPGFVEKCRPIREACEAIGRDPATMTFSLGLGLAIGETEAEARRRASVHSADGPHLVGTPAQIAERLAAYREVGAETCYLQLFDLDQLDQIRLVGAELLPLLR